MILLSKRILNKILHGKIICFLHLYSSLNYLFLWPTQNNAWKFLFFLLIKTELTKNMCSFIFYEWLAANHKKSPRNTLHTLEMCSRTSISSKALWITPILAKMLLTAGLPFWMHWITLIPKMNSILWTHLSPTATKKLTLCSYLLQASLMQRLKLLKSIMLMKMDSSRNVHWVMEKTVHWKWQQMTKGRMWTKGHMKTLCLRKWNANLKVLIQLYLKSKVIQLRHQVAPYCFIIHSIFEYSNLL